MSTSTHSKQHVLAQQPHHLTTHPCSTSTLTPGHPEDRQNPPVPSLLIKCIRVQTLNAWHCMMSAIRPKEMLIQKGTEPKQAVVESVIIIHMLHRVLYPQVHANGLKKQIQNC